MAIIPALPFQLQNGTTADATQVMADFNQILNSVNANAAKNGANNDITALLGLTTPIAPAVGGTPVFIGGTSTGSANAQVVNPVVPNVFGLTAGYTVVFIAGFANSGALTLNVAASGAKNVFRQTIAGPAAMAGGEIRAGQLVIVAYDGTQFQMLGQNSDSALYDASGNLVVPGTLTSTGIFTQSSTSHEVLPNGTTAQRPGSPAAGMFRYNSTLGTVEFYNGTAWAQPIVANPIPGQFRKLLIQNNAGTPNTQIDITADYATVGIPTGGIGYLLSTVSVTINFATTGANGLDTGAIGASTAYFFYLIYNPTTNTVAGLGSLSATAPTLPAGYTAYARLGASFTDASSHFYRVIQKGRIAQYIVGTNPANTLVLSNGTVGTYSQTAPTLSSISLTGFVPTTASRAQFLTAQQWKNGALANILLAPNTAWGGANNGPAGSSGNVYPVHADTINKASIPVWLELEALSVAWASSAAGGALAILGWEDNL